MLQLPQSVVIKLLTDPVMAAYVLMGWELDTFQQARLRYYWFVPEVIDSSGVSTAKTLTAFLYVNLRCLLLPDHIAGVYYPNFSTLQTEFWPYFARTIEKSEIYRSHCAIKNRVVGERKLPGAWRWEFKSGNVIVGPAPSFMKDAETQGSRRFNTLLVDEWLRSEDMGEGISKQLVDRVTRPNYNDDHPIWTNHMKFLGHADRPSHKGYQTRVKPMKREIRDGSQRQVLISFCFRDYSEAFVAKVSGVLPKHVIASQRRSMSKDQFRRQWLGIWSRDGATYYPEVVLASACHRYLMPVLARRYGEERNFLGFDTAMSIAARADFAAASVLRMVELLSARAELPHNFTDQDGRRYNRAFTFSHRLQQQRGTVLAGFIYALHEAFHFERIVLDPLGGGLFVYGEMREPQQLIHGEMRKVIPLSTHDEGVTIDKLPIVRMFKREHFRGVLQDGYYLHDGSFYAGMHLLYREAWEERSIHLPLPAEDRPVAETSLWTHEQALAQKHLDMARAELVNVRQVTKDDQLVVSRGGFPVFSAVGKKDLAYAGLYAFAAAVNWLADPTFEEEESGDALFVG